MLPRRRFVDAIPNMPASTILIIIANITVGLFHTSCLISSYAPIEINLVPLGIGMLVLAFGYVALLRWVTKDE